jgi:hypothetical protein
MVLMRGTAGWETVAPIPRRYKEGKSKRGRKVGRLGFPVATYGVALEPPSLWVV